MDSPKIRAATRRAVLGSSNSAANTSSLICTAFLTSMGSARPGSRSGNPAIVDCGSKHLSDLRLLILRELT